MQSFKATLRHSPNPEEQDTSTDFEILSHAGTTKAPPLHIKAENLLLTLVHLSVHHVDENQNEGTADGNFGADDCQGDTLCAQSMTETSENWSVSLEQKVFIGHDDLRGASSKSGHVLVASRVTGIANGSKPISGRVCICNQGRLPQRRYSEIGSIVTAAVRSGGGSRAGCCWCAPCAVAVRHASCVYNIKLIDQQ